MRHIAFIYDPDRYWIGMHSTPPVVLGCFRNMLTVVRTTCRATRFAELVPNKF
jgi:hypothetical protein